MTSPTEPYAYTSSSAPSAIKVGELGPKQQIMPHCS